MAGSLHTVSTKEQLTAGFPTIVPAITGDVTLKEIIRVWQHIKGCAQRTETNFDAQNFLYVVLPPGLWPYFSTRPYPAAPIDPGPNPSYHGGADATENTTIRDLWQLNHKYHEEHKHINIALVDRFLKLLPHAHRVAFESNQLTTNPKLSFLEVFDHFWEHFGIATEEELIENTAQLLNPWQPHEGMESLIERFDQAQIYAFFAKNQMDDRTIINYFLAVVKKTGRYTRSYEDWITKPDDQKTYAVLKEFWRLEHLKMKRSNPTAQQYEFGMNVIDSDATNNSTDMASMLEQCANAMMAAQKQQQERQTQFETQMAANLAAMQAQLQSCNMNNNNMMNAAAQQMQATQQMQQQNMANAAQNNNRARNWQAAAWQPMQQQGTPICPPAYNNNMGGGNKTPDKTPFRCFENYNYCWTHGHHIEDDHTSATCTMPNPGHQHAATKQNTMGGSDKGNHKTIMPSQSGRKRQTRKQKAATQPYLMWKAAGFPAGGTKPFWEQLKGQRAHQQGPAMNPMAMATQQYPYVQMPQGMPQGMMPTMPMMGAPTWPQGL